MEERRFMMLDRSVGMVMDNIRVIEEDRVVVRGISIMVALQIDELVDLRRLWMTCWVEGIDFMEIFHIFA
jgi:hypothetical protein